MDIRRVVDSWETPATKKEEPIPFTWHYELTDIKPNADGFYEVSTSVHHVYAAMDIQNFLQEQGFTYVGRKKGDFDTELWQCVQEVANVTFPTVLDSAMPVEVTEKEFNMPEEVATPQVHPTNYAQRPTLDPTTVKCHMCGTEIATSVFRIISAGKTEKTCTLHICMNPQCNFHYVEVRRG